MSYFAKKRYVISILIGGENNNKVKRFKKKKNKSKCDSTQLLPFINWRSNLYFDFSKILHPVGPRVKMNDQSMPIQIASVDFIPLMCCDWV